MSIYSPFILKLGLYFISSLQIKKFNNILLPKVKKNVERLKFKSIRFSDR